MVLLQLLRQRDLFTSNLQNTWQAWGSNISPHVSVSFSNHNDIIILLDDMMRTGLVVVRTVIEYCIEGQ